LLDSHANEVHERGRAGFEGFNLGPVRRSIVNLVPAHRQHQRDLVREHVPDWPPPWPDCLTERREALGRVLRALGASEKTYEMCVDLARDMLTDPGFIRLRDAIARALHQVPRLEREDIEALARIYSSDRDETSCDT
jgi:hypothetical protein